MADSAEASFTRQVYRRMRSLWGASKTSLRKLFGISDLNRWKDVSNLEPGWDSRSQAIAELIQPGSSVLEFGAGRQVLRDFLSNGCAYTPSDIVDRGRGTLVCDLNAKELPDFPVHDVAVFSGVLEYVNDVPRLIAALSSKTKVIVASYVLVERVPDRQARRTHAWVNDYSSRDFEAIFSANDYTADYAADWHSQKIYRFVRKG